MELKAKMLGFEAGGKFIVVLNREDAEDISVSSLDRVRIKGRSTEVIAIVNITT